MENKNKKNKKNKKEAQRIHHEKFKLQNKMNKFQTINLFSICKIEANSLMQTKSQESNKTKKQRSNIKNTAWNLTHTAKKNQKQSKNVATLQPDRYLRVIFLIQFCHTAAR